MRLAIKHRCRPGSAVLLVGLRRRWRPAPSICWSSASAPPKPRVPAATSWIPWRAPPGADAIARAAISSRAITPRGARSRRSAPPYLALFRDAGEARYRGEGVPLGRGQSASDRGGPPYARIIIALRDPIARVHSQHLLLRRSTDQRRATFVEVVTQELGLDEAARGRRCVHERGVAGLYAEGVARYFTRRSAATRSTSSSSEEFVRDTRAEMRRIFEFLGVSAEPLGELVLEAKNRGGVARRRFAAVRAREPSHAKSCRALPGHASSRRMRGHAPGVEPQVRELREPVHAPGDREKLESQLARPLPW